MASGPPSYDGHEALIGVYGGAPSMVPRFYAHQAVNRFFRNDENLTRPSIRNIHIEFESEADRIWFEGANGQGAFFYNRYPSTSSPELIASVAGKIFAITVRGRNATARVIFDGNSRTFTHAWFAQGFQWLFIQDGIHAPIFYDGTTARRSNLVAQEMPVGSVMAFIHGRMVVASADGKNSIYVGDIVYGNDTTTPNDLLSFTEGQYWANGGSFDAPTNIGDVNGLYPMPFLDTGTGQNELLVMGAFGFTSLDLSGPRSEWINNSVQRVSMIGQGLVSSHGFAGLNGDVFYRRADGIGSFRNARVEYSQRWSQTPISKAVDYWLKSDRNDLLQYVPMVSHQNMVLSGCSPLVEPPNNPCVGYHRFCRGFVVFDAQSMSTASRDGTPVWHGMWTGIRPWAMISGAIDTAQRCFAFSYDRDGRNRLYEITLEQGNDIFEREPRKIFSRYDTAEMGSVEGRTSLFGLKKMTGGVLEMNNILGESTFNVSYRPDGAPCFVDIVSGTVGCDCPEFVCGVNGQPNFARHYFPSVNDRACVPGTSQAGNVFHHAQVRVEMEGSLRVERLNIRFDIEKEGEIAKCSGTDCKPIDCCPNANDYTYHIAPVGVNTEIPDVDCGVVPEIFVSTRYFTAFCPGDPTRFATGIGQGVSDVSQADADAKALAAAQQNAENQLVCFSCEPESIFEFSINGGTEDLAAFFTAGLFSANATQPWRLQDVIIDQTIAYGFVNDAGTLETSGTFGPPEYAHGSFDPVTNVYTDLGGGSTTIELQIGCNNGTNFVWPRRDPY
jgi:hypothetical protein